MVNVLFEWNIVPSGIQINLAFSLPFFPELYEAIHPGICEGKQMILNHSKQKASGLQSRYICDVMNCKTILFIVFTIMIKEEIFLLENVHIESTCAIFGPCNKN